MTKTVLVTGATGNVSTAVLAQLRGVQGLNVRALARDPGKAEALRQKGFEVVRGDLDDPESLDKVFDGVDVIWLLNGMNPRAAENSMNAVWAAKHAGVQHIVRLSAVGAGHDAPTRNGRLHIMGDEQLMASGPGWTILRPLYFMQNLFASAASVASDGVLYGNVGAGRIGMIDYRDVAEMAAKIITNPKPFQGKIFTPTGPVSISMEEVAEQLGQVLEKPVKYVATSQDAARQAMLGMGLPAWLVGMLIEYGQAYSEDWGNFVTHDFQTVTGHPPRSFRQFAEDFASVFGRQATAVKG